MKVHIALHHAIQVGTITYLSMMCSTVKVKRIVSLRCFFAKNIFNYSLRNKIKLNKIK